MQFTWMFQLYENHYQAINAKTISVHSNLKKNNHIFQDWRFNILGKVNGPNVKLLNEVEVKTYGNEELYTPIDQFAAASFLFPKKLVQHSHLYNATVILKGSHRSVMTINPLSKDYNVNIIRKISAREFKRIMIWTANY